MKKAYVKPAIETETFVANRCVAACENPSSYVGYCDISGYVYADSNNNGQYDEGRDRYLYYNTACDRMYESQEQPHFNAFVVEKHWVWDGFWEGGHWETEVTRVFNYERVHVTQHIDPVKHYNVSI